MSSRRVVGLGLITTLFGGLVWSYDDHVAPSLEVVRVARRAGRAPRGVPGGWRLALTSLRDFSSVWPDSTKSTELERLLKLNSVVVLTGDYLSLVQAGRNFVQSVKYNHNFVVSWVMPHNTPNVVQSILDDLGVKTNKPSLEAFQKLCCQLVKYHACKLVVVLDATQHDFDVLLDFATTTTQTTHGLLVLILARNIDVARSTLQGQLSKSTRLVDVPIVAARNSKTSKHCDSRRFVSRRAFENSVLQVGSLRHLNVSRNKFKAPSLSNLRFEHKDALPSSQVPYNTFRACKAFCEQAPNWPDLARALESSNTQLSFHDCTDVLGKHEFCEFLKVASSADFFGDLFAADLEHRTFGFATLEARTCFETLLA